MKKLKQFQIMIAKNFPAYHPKAGQPTNFKEQILDGVKIHTGRENFAYWQPIINQVNRGIGVLNLKQWSGRPYNSTPETFLTLTKAGIQKFDIDINGVISIDKFYLDEEQDVSFPKNDGLSDWDFQCWFKLLRQEFDGGLIHFTDFRY